MNTNQSERKNNSINEGTEDPRIKSLIAYGASIDSKELVPVLENEAATLIKENPFAFMLAAVLDRGTKAEIIWTIPYYIKQQLGSLGPSYFSYASLSG